MKKQYINRQGQLVDLDDSGVVPEGGTIRVHAFLQDGVPMTSNVRVVDAAGRTAGSRPGFLLDADDNETQARIAYDASCARMESAWRGANNPAAVRDSRPISADDIEAERARMKDRISNAWRSTGGTGFHSGY